MFARLFILIQWASLVATFLTPPAGVSNVDVVDTDPHRERAPIGLELFELIELEEVEESDGEDHPEEDPPRGDGDVPEPRVTETPAPRPRAALYRAHSPRGPPLPHTSHHARAHLARGPPAR